MEIKLSQLAERLGRPLVGGGPETGQSVIRGISTLESATENQISFVVNTRFAAPAQASAAAALLVPADATIQGKATIPFDNVWEGILSVIRIFHPEKDYEVGVHPTAVVDASAVLGESVSVQPHAVIERGVTVGPRTVIKAGSFIGEGAKIGADCHIGPRAVVMHQCSLGDRVILQPGAVIGADGFKYEFMGGRHVKIPQIGVVVVEDDVEIGANTCIDRASFNETRIGRGTKIDNLTQIGHNVRIGENCIIVSQVGISGSVTIGDRTVLAGQVGIADHLDIGSDVTLGAKTGVHKSVPDGATLFGYPALPSGDAMRVAAFQSRLPKFLAEFRQLRETVQRLDEQSGDPKTGD